jgi:uncharacterized protein (UPF0332 family)
MELSPLAGFALEKAHETLCDARQLLEDNDLPNSKDRSYTAVLQAADALLYAKGGSPCEEHQTMEFLKVAYPEFFSRLPTWFGLRAKKDPILGFRHVSGLETEDADKMIADAFNFLQSVQKLIFKKP